MRLYQQSWEAFTKGHFKKFKNLFDKIYRTPENLEPKPKLLTLLFDLFFFLIFKVPHRIMDT